MRAQRATGASPSQREREYLEGELPMAVHRSTADPAARRVASGKRGRRQTYYTVEQNQRIFTAYFGLEFELFTFLAGAIPALPELEAKIELSHHAHSAMLRARELRDRLDDFLVGEPEIRIAAR